MADAAIMTNIQNMAMGTGQVEGVVGNLVFKGFPSAFVGASIPGGIFAASGFDLGKISPKIAQNHIGVAPTIGQGFGSGLMKGGEGGAQAHGH